MTIPNGTNDALIALQEKATRAGKPFNVKNVHRRGRADDGGQTGRLVLVGNNGAPLCDTKGNELAVPWCTTGERVPAFPALDKSSV